MASVQTRKTVTAIIPLYNGGAFIETSLGSVISQSRPPAEIIWQRALTALGYSISYVVTHRSPWAVLSSNQKINGLSDETNFRLVVLSDLLPRVFLSEQAGVVHVIYEDLVAAPDSTCAMLAGGLHLDTDVSTGSASAAVDRSLAHYL